MTFGEETALLFVMNRKYIRPLKVLLYSLLVHKSMIKCPIEVFTDDSAVVADPFIKNIATNVQFVRGRDLEAFQTIRGERIREKSRTQFAPKYTFLKFVNFLDRGYSRHVCMDADMLCMRALNEELLGRDYDVKAMIELGSSKYPIRDEKRTNFDLNASMELTRNIMVSRDKFPAKSINSGFMVLQGKAISNDLFDTAVKLASTEAFEAEQPATTAAIRSIPELRFLELPIWYNARRRVFECFGEEYFEMYRDEIRLLHYTPGKPWGVFGDREPDFLDHLWYDWEERSKDWVAAVTAGEDSGWVKGERRDFDFDWNRAYTEEG